MRRQTLAAVALATIAPLVAIAAGDAAITEYEAEYEVFYNGRHVAQAEFSVAQQGESEFLFRSETRARGLWRLASPGTAIERSRFLFSDGRIRPVRFEYDDGSRKGEDSYSVDFTGSSGEVVISGAGGSQSIPFDAQLLDRGSLQVALMVDLSSCQVPESYRYVDDDGERTYLYTRLENQTADTGIGTISAMRFSQKREGSSRETILWTAPGYANLPVRIEQIRDGEIETVFVLDELSGIEAAPADCSGLR